MYIQDFLASALSKDVDLKLPLLELFLYIPWDANLETVLRVPYWLLFPSSTCLDQFLICPICLPSYDSFQNDQLSFSGDWLPFYFISSGAPWFIWFSYMMSYSLFMPCVNSCMDLRFHVNGM